MKIEQAIARKVLSITADSTMAARQTVFTVYYSDSYGQMATRTLLGKAHQTQSAPADTEKHALLLPGARF